MTPLRCLVDLGPYDSIRRRIRTAKYGRLAMTVDLRGEIEHYLTMTGVLMDPTNRDWFMWDQRDGGAVRFRARCCDPYPPASQFTASDDDGSRLHAYDFWIYVRRIDGDTTYPMTRGLAYNFHHVAEQGPITVRRG